MTQRDREIYRAMPADERLWILTQMLKEMDGYPHTPWLNDMRAVVDLPPTQPPIDIDIGYPWEVPAFKPGDRVLVTGQRKRTWLDRLLRRNRNAVENGVYIAGHATRSN